MRIAHLGMYDLEELKPETNALWAGMARAFRAEGIEDVPDALGRGRAFHDVWHDDDLLFSQTCGYPLMTSLKGRVSLVATPVYACPGAGGSDYCSLILVRDDDPAEDLPDLAGRRVAVNAADSQSGYSALRSSFAPLARAGRFFGEVLTSGGHAASLQMVAEGAADVCACDCVTYHLLARVRPAAVSRLRAIAQSPSAPSLPYVTRGGAGRECVMRLRAGLARAMADPDLAAAREALMITGVEVLPLKAYDRILEIEADAVGVGYPIVA